MTYINKVVKPLLQLGYWFRFESVSKRSITETCVAADGKAERPAELPRLRGAA
ncbi:hypothetical protein [Azospirillum sp. B510]|uniref:hypothetical protein n=1 Tax=Azospirillum sp. (strain B510) TaxID=137722 RepID=UPI00130528B9|nr:hypothetical protein [Azospirillum sp. B510]